MKGILRVTDNRLQFAFRSCQRLSSSQRGDTTKSPIHLRRGAGFFVRPRKPADKAISRPRLPVRHSGPHWKRGAGRVPRREHSDQLPEDAYARVICGCAYDSDLADVGRAAVDETCEPVVARIRRRKARVKGGGHADFYSRRFLCTESLRSGSDSNHTLTDKTNWSMGNAD